MKIHEATEEAVELTEREQEVVDQYDFYRNVHGIPEVDAAKEALDHFKGKPSKQFVEWLSSGALTKNGTEIVAKVDGEVDSAA